jgi:hypothetical protein
MKNIPNPHKKICNKIYPHPIPPTIAPETAPAPDSPLSEDELISQNHFKVKKLTLTYTDKNTGNE